MVQGKIAKNLVFGFDFMIYGAPFHKWYRFTYDAVTVVAFSWRYNNAPEPVHAWSIHVY